MSLTSEYSLWLIIVCILLAVAGTTFLYYHNKLDLSGKYGRLKLYALVSLRFLCLFLISFLLLGPLLKFISSKVEKPFVILALDNSQSLVAGRDSASVRKSYPEIISRIKDGLSSDYEIRTYTFGKDVKENSGTDFSEKQTDISKVFEEINTAYTNQNLGAVILASDGIYNEGESPVYTSKALNSAVFPIAFGDTSRRKDALIRNVKHNQLVYEGNVFPMQVDLNAYGCAGQNVTLTISQNTSEVFRQNLSIGAGAFFTSIPVELQAKGSGTLHYRVQISRLSGEATYVNNQFDVFITVINGKQKISLVALAPHPDLSALRQSIESNENYEVKLSMVEKTDVNTMLKSNLVILHQLPGARGEGLGLLKALKEKKIPVLYILGAQTSLGMLATVENRLSISGNRMNTNDALALYNPSFPLFTLSDDEIAIIKKFPPLIAPYGTYRMSGEANVLFRQQIGYVTTDMPLIFFSRSEGSRAGFICGEGYWKWRLHDAALSRQQTINSLTGKIVQYLALKDDNRLLRVNGKKRFNENEKISFDAELYNESYELINTTDVLMKISNPQGKVFTYSFSKTDKAYTLDAGSLPPGQYSYEASASLGNRKETVKGSFVILPLQVEFLQTVADHQLLNEIALSSGGKLFYPSQADALIDAIRKNENIRPVIYEQEEVKSWINLRWIFFLLLGLLSVEWFIRKWNGTV